MKEKSVPAVQPLISIVMPAYKAEHTIIASVQSALAQTYAHWELVISIDDQVDYVALLHQHGLLDKRIRFVTTGAMGTGSSNARNVGMAAARSQYIAVLDADDLFTPGKLDIIAPLLASHPLISTGLQICASDLQPLRQVGCFGGKQMLDAAHYKGMNFSMDSMIVFDREKLPISYDPSQPCLVDLDLIFKAFCHAPTCLHLGVPLHLYRKQAVSISNGPAAGDKFTQMKTKLISRLENGVYDFVQGDSAKAGFLNFLHHSLATELVYASRQNDDPSLLFEDLLEAKLSQNKYI